MLSSLVITRRWGILSRTALSNAISCLLNTILKCRENIIRCSFSSFDNCPSLFLNLPVRDFWWWYDNSAHEQFVISQTCLGCNRISFTNYDYISNRVNFAIAIDVFAAVLAVINTSLEVGVGWLKYKKWVKFGIDISGRRVIYDNTGGIIPLFSGLVRFPFFCYL